jgi:glycosyltransferase involved in cell wall biosynthesis
MMNIVDAPVLSIVTITYNNLKGLETTFQSLMECTGFEQVQWIVIDGNSTDGTKDFLEPDKAKISYFVSEPDRGIYDAMNKGLVQAKGVYIWFLNAGDAGADPDLIERIYASAKSKPDIIYSDTILVDEQMKTLGLRSELSTRKLPKKLSKESFQRGMVVSHQSFIVKRSLAPEYNLNYGHVADLDWVINCVGKAKEIVFLPKPISKFVVGGHSTLNRGESLSQRFGLLVHHFGWWKTVFNHLIIILVNLGHKLSGGKNY